MLMSRRYVSWAIGALLSLSTASVQAEESLGQEKNEAAEFAFWNHDVFGGSQLLSDNLYLACHTPRFDRSNEAWASSRIEFEKNPISYHARYSEFNGVFAVIYRKVGDEIVVVKSTEVSLVGSEFDIYHLRSGGAPRIVGRNCFQRLLNGDILLVVPESRTSDLSNVVVLDGSSGAEKSEIGPVYKTRSEVLFQHPSWGERLLLGGMALGVHAIDLTREMPIKYFVQYRVTGVVDEKEGEEVVLDNTSWPGGHILYDKAPHADIPLHKYDSSIGNGAIVAVDLTSPELKITRKWSYDELNDPATTTNVSDGSLKRIENGFLIVTEPYRTVGIATGGVLSTFGTGEQSVYAPRLLVFDLKRTDATWKQPVVDIDMSAIFIPNASRYEKCLHPEFADVVFTHNKQKMHVVRYDALNPRTPSDGISVTGASKTINRRANVTVESFGLSQTLNGGRSVQPIGEYTIRPDRYEGFVRTVDDKYITVYVGSKLKGSSESNSGNKYLRIDPSARTNEVVWELPPNPTRF